MTRPVLPETKVSVEAAQKIHAFHADVVHEVQNAIEKDRVVVVGMAQNPFVRKIRKALTEAGVSFQYLEYGSYFKSWRERLAIKLWTGWPTFPQVFVDGKLVGGCEEAQLKLKTGALIPKS